MIDVYSILMGLSFVPFMLSLNDLNPTLTALTGFSVVMMWGAGLMEGFIE